LEFIDNKGRHLASPDIVLPELRIAVEVKRTYTPEADAQLQLLYLPLLKFIWPGEWKLIVACQFWAGEEKELISTFLSAQPGMNYLLRR
jgi:hypothetical protein